MELHYKVSGLSISIWLCNKCFTVQLYINIKLINKTNLHFLFITEFALSNYIIKLHWAIKFVLILSLKNVLKLYFNDTPYSINLKNL